MKKSSSKSKTAIRIILADDHHIVRSGIRQLLESEDDLKVLAEAGDGEEAQALIEKHKPDVAVLDIQMPKASGIEVTRWVRAHFPEVGVLILTAYDDDPYVMAVLQAGANGYVLKTAQADDLIQAVRDVNEGKSALDPTITRKLMSTLFKPSEKITAEPLTDRELDVLRLA
ncbi:MAG TPA: response regulator transcription factor, partial [Anaerolineales bacterium]|nr:response regulator transcription factor [Anaerolineales bacterium]